MTTDSNNAPAMEVTPEAVTAGIDAINAGIGWPGCGPEPCAGHMVHGHRPVEGVDVTDDGALVEFRVGGILVGSQSPGVASETRPCGACSRTPPR
jgi:hypothetical protein